MKLKDIVEHLNGISPLELCEDWDNSGLLLGDMKQDIKEVYLSIDIDTTLASKLPENSLIITHHPLVFKGLKKFDTAKYPSNILQTLMKKDVALISLHTNFDKTHLNRYVAQNVLGFDVECEQDFVCVSKVDMSFDEVCDLVSKKLNIKNFRYVKSSNNIKK